MKKLLTLFAVFALTAPVLAAEGDPNVEITCSADGNVVTVSYEVKAQDGFVPADDPMRGLALNITVDGGATIDAISDYLAGSSGDESGDIPQDGFPIFMGSIQFATDPNKIADYGDPVAPSGDPGALGGLGTAGITIEMGSLYPEGGDAPDPTGVLFKITVSGPTTVTIEGESTRGGDLGEAVRESGGLLNVISSGCTVEEDDECFPNTYTTYSDWVLLGKPDCWCAPPEGTGYQCDGDADGITSGLPFNYRVYFGDLNLIWANWQKKAGDASLNPCADIDHKSSGLPFNYRVYFGDLNVIWTNWQAKDTTLAGDCPRPE